MSTQEIVDDFTLIPENQRLNMLLEYSEKLPDLPNRFEGLDLERVEECQAPVFLAVEVIEKRANLFFDVPREAPTTRGFASILHTALNGQIASDVLAFDESFIEELGLTTLVSPLRIRGMRGMLARIKRQVTESIES